MSYIIEKALFFNRRIINGLHNFMTYLPDGESLKKLHPSRFIIDDMPTQMNGGVTFNTHYKCHFEHIYETHFIELNLTRIKLYLEFHGIPQKLLVLKKKIKDDKQIGYRIHIGFENAEENELNRYRGLLYIKDYKKEFRKAPWGLYIKEDHIEFYPKEVSLNPTRTLTVIEYLESTQLNKRRVIATENDSIWGIAKHIYKDIAEDKIISFFLNGKTFLLKDAIDNHTAIEKVFHPIISAIYKDNKNLFNKLSLHLEKQYPKLVLSISEGYQSIKESDLSISNPASLGLPRYSFNELDFKINNVSYLLSKLFLDKNNYEERHPESILERLKTQRDSLKAELFAGKKRSLKILRDSEEFQKLLVKIKKYMGMDDAKLDIPEILKQDFDEYNFDLEKFRNENPIRSQSLINVVNDSCDWYLNTIKRLHELLTGNPLFGKNNTLSYSRTILDRKSFRYTKVTEIDIGKPLKYLNDVYSFSGISSFINTQGLQMPYIYPSINEDEQERQNTLWAEEKKFNLLHSLILGKSNPGRDEDGLNRNRYNDQLDMDQQDPEFW